MNDVKKTWCGPVYTLDPEKMERQFNRLSAEGWQLEGTGWFSLRYRRGKPNEYRYRVQYLYESRDGQKDDYVRGLAELGVELVMDIGSFLILRRRNDGTPFELFSDLDSQITSEKSLILSRFVGMSQPNSISKKDFNSILRLLEVFDIGAYKINKSIFVLL